MNEHDVMETAVTGDASELLGVLKDKALRSFFFFAKVVMGYSKMVAHLHYPICERLQNNPQIRKSGNLLPRGHFKSTIISKAYPLWRTIKVAYDEDGTYHPERLGDFRTLILGESDKVAKKNLKDPKWHLLNNQLLRSLFPEIIPLDVNDTTWTGTEILLPRANSYDEATIMTAGVGARMTGLHFNLIIYDDLIGEAASQSEAVMQDAIEYFDFAPGLLDEPSVGEEIILGTRWKHGTADLYGHVMSMQPEELTVSGRSIGFNWYTRSAIENGEPIFPERFSLEVLEELRKRLGDYKFSCNYLNDPIAPGSTKFDASCLREYTVSEDKKTIIPSDGTPPVRLGQLYRIQVYDPATRSKTSKARPAVVATGEDSLGRLFLLEYWSEKASMGDGVEKMHVFHDRFHFSKSYYELAGQQQAVEDIERERLTQEKCHRCGKIHRIMRLLPETAKVSNMSKEERIDNYLETRIQEKKLYLRRGAIDARKQIIAHPNGDIVDILDALAYCSHLSRKPLSDESILAEREHEEARKEVIASSRCNTEHFYGGYV